VANLDVFNMIQIDTDNLKDLNYLPSIIDLLNEQKSKLSEVQFEYNN